jgi:transposase
MNEQTRNEVIRRWLVGQSQRSIARQLHISRPTVHAIVKQYQRARQEGAPAAELPQKQGLRKSLLADQTQRIAQLLARYPNITVTRLFEELKAAGYTGGYTILREHVKELQRRCASTSGPSGIWAGWRRPACTTT